MPYSAKVLDHFHHPRYAGELEDATFVAQATNPVCGDVMKLWLRIEEGRVKEATFKADGCVPSIACGDWLAEWLSAGCTLDEARSITPETIAAGLDGLPPASSHAADLAVEALRKALDVVSRKT
jgi:nitrogen fixation protein NifU and related proteins